VTNVSGGDEAVKAPPAPAAPAAPAGSDDPGRDALEVSKLLVEVLQVGHMTRRSGQDGTAAPEGVATAFTAGGVAGAHAQAGPIASHVIRAAIHIYGNGPQTIGQLAVGIGVSQGWASRVVDEMERAGYVERRRDPADRRVVRVSLVPAAVERVERVYRWRGDAVEAALEGLSDADRAIVIGFLRRFVHVARERA
jgi:DNA-binding MarR family transcriptional regulator